jgi:hypothetical protein
MPGCGTHARLCSFTARSIGVSVELMIASFRRPGDKPVWFAMPRRT